MMELSHKYTVGEKRPVRFRGHEFTVLPIMEIIHSRGRMVLFEQVPDEYDPSIGTTYGDAQARAIRAFMDFCNEMDKKDGH